ncbi:hypothetical protein GOP47_0001706 [Adiantum capillus-veneris]|uniref:Uncharacterized protein n=1 Tax=Adiantum capillus-veneris TaxID=13818 RepID=A0A9D4VA85_ADICA|nr:hypothetical protein GOP47_0001706 [Adiantum capillus-veneris]
MSFSLKLHGEALVSSIDPLLKVFLAPSFFFHFWHICKSPITSRKLSNQHLREQSSRSQVAALQRTAVKDHHQPSSEQVSQVDTLSDEMQTVRHHPLLYTAYLEPLHTSLRMGTPAYDDLPPSSNSHTPFYGGLPASGYNAMVFDKHVNSQLKHSFDLGSTYIGSLSDIIRLCKLSRTTCSPAIAHVTTSSTLQESLGISVCKAAVVGTELCHARTMCI